VSLAFLSTAFFGGSLNQWLVDHTGETELKYQVVGLYSQLFQRAIDTRDLVPIAHTDVNPYGVNVFFEQEVEEWKLRRSMEMIRQAGARWIRLHVPWSDIEVPAKGQYMNRFGKSTWEKYDRIVELAQEYGLQILARLDDPPNWSRTDNTVHNRPPDDFRDFGDFVFTFVSRYKGKIRYYQIWNEPNVYPEWGNQPVDAAAYVDLLKIAYTRAKEADPDSVILAAPLAPTLGTPDGMNQNDLLFLQEMYDAGAKDYFDIMSVNAYGLWTGPGDRRAEKERTNFSRPLLIREIMVKNGDEHKAIWAAEVGWNALPPDFPGPATHGRVTLAQQASYTVAAYRRIQREWPWLGVAFYWHFRMVREQPDQVVYYYSMVKPDFTPLPVYHAYRRLANSPPVVPYGYHQEDHWALTYQGSWTFQKDNRAVLGSYASSQGPASFSFTFRGTGLDLVTVRGPGLGRAYVRIDGTSRQANRLPRDTAGRAYLKLERRQPQWQARVPIASGLPYGEHRVEITVPAGFALDGLVVAGTPPPWWRSLAGASLLVVSMAALLSAYLRR
jgi:hypothetical protein